MNEVSKGLKETSLVKLVLQLQQDFHLDRKETQESETYRPVFW